MRVIWSDWSENTTSITSVVQCIIQVNLDLTVGGSGGYLESRLRWRKRKKPQRQMKKQMRKEMKKEMKDVESEANASREEVMWRWADRSTILEMLTSHNDIAHVPVHVLTLIAQYCSTLHCLFFLIRLTLSPLESE